MLPLACFFQSTMWLCHKNQSCWQLLTTRLDTFNQITGNPASTVDKVHLVFQQSYIPPCQPKVLVCFCPNFDASCHLEPNVSIPGNFNRLIVGIVSLFKRATGFLHAGLTLEHRKHVMQGVILSCLHLTF